MRSLEASLFWHTYTMRKCLRSELAEQLRTSPAAVSRAVDALLAKRLLTRMLRCCRIWKRCPADAPPRTVPFCFLHPDCCAVFEATMALAVAKELKRIFNQQLACPMPASIFSSATL